MSKVLSIDDADDEQPKLEDAGTKAAEEKDKKAARDDKEEGTPKGKAKKTGGRGKGRGKGKITGQPSGSLAKRRKVGGVAAAAIAPWADNTKFFIKLFLKLVFVMICFTKIIK